MTIDSCVLCTPCLFVQAKLFPIHRPNDDEEEPQESTTNDNPNSSKGNNPAAQILWMQNVRDIATSSTAFQPLLTPPTASGTSDAEVATTSTVKSWLAAERLSFKDILRRAEPSAEFEWRRRLEEGMESSAEGTGDMQGAGCR